MEANEKVYEDLAGGCEKVKPEKDALNLGTHKCLGTNLQVESGRLIKIQIRVVVKK